MKPINDKLHPALKAAIAAAVLLIPGWLLLQRFQIGIEFLPSESDRVPVIKTQPSDAPATRASTNSKATTAAKPDPADAAARQGKLRIRNRSDHPLRVALLSRQKEVNKGASTGFATPAHWDFAPGEGSTEGLLVSLPDREVKLKKGDVVVAFAQDGSQRYWGPFVVGETDGLAWNAGAAEWELVLDE
ncbi:MAG: hypothetical protein KME13_16900 [Myxacorys californica WJT36-NPBG1]|jgi:hypothetical protein|nr:hypothetical protein [Myxacorys californica WJT36-NPBG1]